MFRPLHYLVVLLLAVGSAGEGWGRTWTSSYGKAIEGELVEFDGETVELKLADGRMSKFKVSLLSEDDQVFLREWKESVGGGVDEAPASREWPEQVEVDISLDDIVIVEEDRDKERYVYRSPHFEFEANGRLSKNVVRDFSQVFEATLEAVRALPINLDAKPPEDGYWDVKLFNTEEQYFRDGAPEGSGGVYFPSTGLVKVPLPHLGVDYTGVRYVVDSSKTNATLKHEIVHQVMHDLLPYMPVWMYEGFAEFVQCMPYSNGRYRFNDVDDAIKEYVAEGEREYELVDLQSLMEMDGETWAEELLDEKAWKNYESSCVLLYYFLRIDGEGDGAGIFSYLDEVLTAEGVRDWDAVFAKAQKTHILRDRDFDTLRAEISERLRSNNTLGLRITFGEPSEISKKVVE